MLHKDFVYLHEIIPSIRYRAYYYYDFNFIGKRVDGYERDVIIMTKEASNRLKKVQEAVMRDGFSLFVMDAYRPLRACRDFVKWSNDLENQSMKEVFYPSLTKREIMEGGYVSDKSSHCRGSTIDTTLIRLDKEIIKDPKVINKILPDGKIIPFFDNGSIEMGSSFDLFDEVSHTKYPNISEEAKANRKYLINNMENFGFMNYAAAWGDNPQEWWHFTLKDEPFTDQYFDFEVK